MSDLVYEQISDGMSQLNNALRGAFSRDGVRFFLLGQSGQTGKYALVEELTTDFFVEWSEWRQAMFFAVTRTEPEFINTIAKTTAVGYGVPVDSKVDLFTVSPDLIDRIPPDGLDAFWKLYGTRKAHDRYTIVEP